MTDLADAATIQEAPLERAALPPPAPTSAAIASPFLPPAPPTASPSAQPPSPIDGRGFLAPELPDYRPPTVPMVAAAVPVPPVAASRPTGTIADFGTLTVTQLQHKKKKKKKRRGGRRAVSFLFTMAVLGGLGAAGYVYGPDLLERWRERGTTAGPDEADAPLDFPVQSAAPIAVRNATFVLADADADGSARRYEITTDFETRVSRVLIFRDDLPTLEVMTLFDQAVVRRIDDDVWYQTPRGQFPLDDQLERTRWVRLLDELIPPANRPNAAIARSTTSMLADEQMRHLVIAIDPALLGGPTLSTESFQSPADIVGAAPAETSTASTAPTAPSATVGGSAPDLASPAASPAGVPVEVPVVPPAGDVANRVAPEPVELELWIDSRGIVRQILTPDGLGGSMLTVLSVSPDAWIPEFPPLERIEPITASALVRLGL